MSAKNLFIRNDDVRGSLDDTLVYLTDALLEKGFPITHAVEPANVSEEVVRWLRDRMEAYPRQLELIQHGLAHKQHCSRPPGEFGVGRPRREQAEDIRRGCDLMNRHFGDGWFRAFSFPFGGYNADTLHALEDAGYRVISTGIRFTRKRRIYNRLGRLLRRKHLAGRNVVYFGADVPGYRFREYPVVLNHTARQIDEDHGEQKSATRLYDEWRRLPSGMDRVGILTHHRFTVCSDMDELVAFLERLRESGRRFHTLKELSHA
ncbi:polysaccharide deacetylase family protein [Kiritimatiella glycovorans]|uniref:NodB homology domain-containing protein n=1 Tax=Kiritimatiella glycovorans TaxID=1307763 RepID=A0A0G3EJA2_9BACT|nr:polysaccharide deacetylase family protein [Kiritimatiella glycovorans]AKJ65517.1 hypothetical protein L21SP4_02290 [Kiritimatiella glycovorans]